VGIDTIIDWEFGRNQPTAKFTKTIIDFLGYIPFSGNKHTLGQQLYHARLVAGKTQKQLAKIIGCDTNTITNVESDGTKIRDKTRIKIQDYVNNAVADLSI
jgi:DNA-binding XRE family transcriptional regulator